MKGSCIYFPAGVTPQTNSDGTYKTTGGRDATLYIQTTSDGVLNDSDFTLYAGIYILLFPIFSNDIQMLLEVNSFEMYVLQCGLFSVFWNPMYR